MRFYMGFLCLIPGSFPWKFIDNGFAYQELFSEIGELKRYAIHYDKTGRPSVKLQLGLGCTGFNFDKPFFLVFLFFACYRDKYICFSILDPGLFTFLGSAEVLFARRSDAFQALKRYNNVQLDGRPMKIEIEGSKPEIPISARVNVVGGLNGQRTVVMRSGVGRGRVAAASANRAFGLNIFSVVLFKPRACHGNFIPPFLNQDALSGRLLGIYEINHAKIGDGILSVMQEYYELYVSTRSDLLDNYYV
ncbi:Nucleotide-binding, alpha-beta plait [Artemisia annua]|uniref:Nucleotide-binding, alpha-beta plait n=1 Tax=Artemisia annua TaxID=35608 RepID=A0A2U1M2W5_ARTAN|nr:Nucleotide-binding, alpha-beta plait [Artemisia annua]